MEIPPIMEIDERFQKINYRYIALINSPKISVKEKNTNKGSRNKFDIYDRGQVIDIFV